MEARCESVLIEEARRAKDKKIPVKYLGDTYRIDYIRKGNRSELDWFAFIHRLGPHERFFNDIDVDISCLVEVKE